MSRILFKDAKGVVRESNNARAGQMPIANAQDGWDYIDLSADSIAYVDSSQYALKNIQEALNWLIAKLIATSSATDKQGKVLDKQVALVDDLQVAVRQLATTVAKLDAAAASHPPSVVSERANPALSIDNASQKLVLDLKTKGSYNNLTSLLGSDNIQGAIDELARAQRAQAASPWAKMNDLENMMNAMREIREINVEQTHRIEALEKKIAERE